MALNPDWAPSTTDKAKNSNTTEKQRQQRALSIAVREKEMWKSVKNMEW